MTVQFDCECGQVVSSNGSEGPEIAELLACDGCGAEYAITITQTGPMSPDRFGERFGGHQPTD